ncbi:MAG: hypothetical protein ACO1OF_14035 [Adhaeribacter sp.]
MEESRPSKIKSYSKESIIALIKIHLSILGPFGTAIDEVLFGMGERVRGQRLENLVDALSKKVKEIDDYKLDSSYFESEDFYDLTINIFNSSIRTKSQEKLKILSEIFIDGVNRKINFEFDLNSILINILNDLTENHIIVFKFLYFNQANLKDINSFEEFFTIFNNEVKDVEIDKYEFRMYLRDLENKTLLIFSQDLKEYGSSGGFIALESYVKAPSMVVTSIGERFALMLKS